MIERKLPKANLDIGAVREFADGLDTHANSDVPSIAPQSIQDQLTETISLSEQLLDEWNHRLKNNLQNTHSPPGVGIPQGPQLGSSRGAVGCNPTHRGDRNRATGLLFRGWLYRRERAGPCQRYLRQCPNSVRQRRIDRLQNGQGGSSKRDSYAARFDHQ
jgi:hypothetical protein